MPYLSFPVPRPVLPTGLPLPVPAQAVPPPRASPGPRAADPPPPVRPAHQVLLQETQCRARRHDIREDRQSAGTARVGERHG